MCPSNCPVGSALCACGASCMNPISPPSKSSLDYLDQMDWPSAVPAREVGNAILRQSSAAPKNSDSSLRNAQPTTVRDTARPQSTDSMPMTSAIERVAEAQPDLARIQADLRNARNQARQLLADLEAASNRMTTDMAAHQRSLRLAISSAQASWTADLQKARYTLLLALALPFLVTALLCVATVGTTWWWARNEVAAARAERDQLTAQTRQLATEFCASAAGRRACRQLGAAGVATKSVTK